MRFIERQLDEDKAVDAVTIDLRGKTSIADAMIVASGTSSRHIQAMAEKLLERLKRAGMTGLGMEGSTGNGDWVLIDAGDVIVHLFRPEARAFYGLERLWAAPAMAMRA